LSGQEFRSSGVQEFRSSGVQEFRSSARCEKRDQCKASNMPNADSRRKIGYPTPSSRTEAAVFTNPQAPLCGLRDLCAMLSPISPSSRTEATVSTNPQAPLCDLPKLCAMLSLFRVTREPLNDERSARCCFHRSVGRSHGARRRIRRQWRK
jgi:hypothetical protein